MQIVVPAGFRLCKSLLVGLTAALKIRLQAPVKIIVLSAIGNFSLAVELDLRNQQLGKSLGIPVNLLFLFVKLGEIGGTGFGGARSFNRLCGRFFSFSPALS